nr:hypothetical protein [Tanacetum cinerariifolium]
MAISVILVSLDSSEGSVRTHAGRVILFGTMLTTIPDTTPVITLPTTHTDTTVIPIEIPTFVPTVLLTVPLSPDHTPALPDITPASPDYSPASPDYSPASPDYSPTSPDYTLESDTKSDPSEDPSSDHIPPLPVISPFLSSADDTTDSDTPDTPPSPTHGTPFTEITSSTQRSPVIPCRLVMILAPVQPIPHDSSSEASSDFHSDASSDSSSRHSLLDHSSFNLPSTSARPYRKRCRSFMTSVLALPPISRVLSHVRADLIPSPKRVRDSGYLADVEVDPRETSLRDDVMVRDALRDRGIDARVIVKTVDQEESEMGTRGPVEVRVERVMLPMMLEDTSEPAQEERVVIKRVQREHERRIVGVKSAVTALTERIAKLKRDTRRLRGTVGVKSQRVDRLQRGILRMQRELRQMRRFQFYDRVRVARFEAKMPNIRSRASMTHKKVEELVARRVAEEIEAREAAMNLKPLNENGDEQEGENRGNGNRGNGGNENRGIKEIEMVGMEEMEMNGENGNGNRNRNHGMNYGGTEGVVGLTRWFKKMETVFNISNCLPKYQVKYATCTLQDSDLTWWNSHKRTIGVDAAYAMKWAGLMKLMTEVYCPRNEIQKMKTELWNLMVKGNDLTAYTQRFQELILLCTRMGYAARSAENKMRMESNPRDNRRQQPLFKRQNTNGQNVARAYTTGKDEKRGSGHFKKDCPKLRNQNHGNQTRNKVGNKTGNQTGGNEATTSAYAIGGGGTNPDFNIVTGTFLLNNCYVSMLFDLGADRSFVSSTFSALLDVAPSTLDTSYAIELADERISETNVVLKGCMLGFLGHPFDIDLMQLELGSFNVIIGMDWLVKYHALIVCDEKVIRIPYGEEVLIILGDDCNGGSKLNIISCTRTQNYIQKGCQVYLTQVTSKKAEDKSEEKRLEDVPIV